MKTATTLPRDHSAAALHRRRNLAPTIPRSIPPPLLPSRASNRAAEQTLPPPRRPASRTTHPGHVLLLPPSTTLPDLQRGVAPQSHLQRSSDTWTWTPMGPQRRSGARREVRCTLCRPPYRRRSPPHAAACHLPEQAAARETCDQGSFFASV